jgi:AAA domain
MAPNTKSGRNALDDRFELDETFLSSPSTLALKSAVLRGTDRRSGEPVVVKYWQKTGSPVDADLREIWRHEMRQNERVRAFPRADDVIVEILESGEADDAFYVVIPGDLAPLEYAARFVKSDHWLRSLRGPRQRVILWQNLRRLAEALGAVHGQGLVHGRIDARSIYTAGAATDADFRLGGFEFSLRMAELHKAPLAAIGRSGSVGVIFSFLDDWKGIGRAVAELLGLDAAHLDDEDAVFLQDRTGIELRPSEIDLVRTLVQPERNRSLDAQIVVGRIDQVLGELESEALANNGRYGLALRFGQTSRLSAALNAASGDAFDTDEVDLQMDFVEADLESGATLARTARGDMYLLTESLAYDLKPLRAAGTDETWSVAVCTNARARDDVRLGRREDVHLSAHRIEPIHLNSATRRLQELRTDALDWMAAFDKQTEADPTLAVRRGLLLVQICEALFKAAEIAPVEVVQQPTHGGKRFVELAAGDSESRMRLVVALNVDDPHKLLRRLFEREEADLNAEWQLTESAGLGPGARAAASVRFTRVLQKENRRVYEFEVIDGVVASNADLHLRKVDDTGTEQVLRRRLRMLAALATQSELASMLADPRARIRSYRSEPLVEDEHFAELDESKQEALRSPWSTGPGQFVVGPPGVGKTKLVTEIVRRMLAGDPTARLLLSAQAHQALDHLAAAVQKKLKATGLDKNARAPTGVLICRELRLPNARRATLRRCSGAGLPPAHRR